MEQYQTDGQRVGLNAWQLKLIAIVAMVIDHLAFSFVPESCAAFHRMRIFISLSFQMG